ncbi:Crp/Fnr family transcriptional regulator [Ottowia caeni]|uniref:Crp/Fnr family transcriptional regulator n=1 Tax=Ottowia caeni TaxID=2870339 RepID=UPI001E4774CE|nr:Crp/Fnr family transcriptional regulator [Ottowia caeni]
MDKNFGGVIPEKPALPAVFRDLEDLVLQSGWTKGLERSVVDHVLGSMHERYVPTGGFVAQSGAPVQDWIGVISGLAKMSVTTSDGRLSTLIGAPPGTWFGEGSLIKSEARRYDVVALRPTRIALMPARIFEWLRETSIPFNHYLQHLLNERLAQFVGLLKSQRLQGTDERVAHCLATLFDSPLFQEPYFLEVNQEEVGLLANVSRQRANLALKRLEELSLIRVEFGGLVVLDMAGLKSFGREPS